MAANEINTGRQTVTWIIAMTLLLAALLTIHPAPAQAGNGHESSCSV